MAENEDIVDVVDQVGADFDLLALDNQLCFPLYAASREVTKRYGPLLKELDLTYTQYITMMVMWEQESLSVKELGARLYLDSGTLTPLLKKLESKGLVTRERSVSDERVVMALLTKRGRDLHDRALTVPVEMGKCMNLSLDEAVELKRLLSKVIDNVHTSHGDGE